MNFFRRIHDRLTGVLGRDCHGKAVRQGDLVEPSPYVQKSSIDPRARCQLIAVRRPDKGDRMEYSFRGVLICINPDGKELQVRYWNAIRKVPQRDQEARWESVKRMTGWTPRTVKQDEETTV